MDMGSPRQLRLRSTLRKTVGNSLGTARTCSMARIMAVVLEASACEVNQYWRLAIISFPVTRTRVQIQLRLWHHALAAKDATKSDSRSRARPNTSTQA